MYAKGETLFLDNAKAKPIECPYIADDPEKTVNGLRQALIDIHEFDEKRVDKFTKLFADLLRKLAESANKPEDEDEDDDTEKTYYVHKYSGGIATEAVIVAGKPRFIQMKGSDLDFDLLSELPIGSRLLKPRDIHSYLCEPYVFESEGEVRYYLKLASKISNNLNFDRIAGQLLVEYTWHTPVP